MGEWGIVDPLTNHADDWSEMTRIRLNEFNRVLRVTRTIPETPEGLYLTDVRGFIRALLHSQTKRRNMMVHSWHSIDIAKILALQLATQYMGVIYESRMRCVYIAKAHAGLVVFDVTNDRERYDHVRMLPHGVHVLHAVLTDNGSFGETTWEIVRESMNTSTRLFIVLGDDRNLERFRPYPNMPGCGHIGQNHPTPGYMAWIRTHEGWIPRHDENDPRPVPRLVENASEDSLSEEDDDSDEDE